MEIYSAISNLAGFLDILGLHRRSTPSVDFVLLGPLIVLQFCSADLKSDYMNNKIRNG